MNLYLSLTAIEVCLSCSQSESITHHLFLRRQLSNFGSAAWNESLRPERPRPTLGYGGGRGGSISPTITREPTDLHWLPLLRSLSSFCHQPRHPTGESFGPRWRHNPLQLLLWEKKTQKNALGSTTLTIGVEYFWLVMSSKMCSHLLLPATSNSLLSTVTQSL